MNIYDEIGRRAGEAVARGKDEYAREKLGMTCKHLRQTPRFAEFKAAPLEDDTVIAEWSEEKQRWIDPNQPEMVVNVCADCGETLEAE